MSLGRAVAVWKCDSRKWLWLPIFLFVVLVLFLANSFSVGTLNSVHMYIWTQIEGLYLLEYTTWFVYLHMICFWGCYFFVWFDFSLSFFFLFSLLFFCCLSSVWRLETWMSLPTFVFKTKTETLKTVWVWFFFSWGGRGWWFFCLFFFFHLYKEILKGGLKNF